MTTLTREQQTELEAAAFRHLVAHPLDARKVACGAVLSKRARFQYAEPLIPPLSRQGQRGCTLYKLNRG